MKRSILLSILCISFYVEGSAQTSVYRNKYFAKKVDCDGKTFKKVISIDDSGKKSVKVYCLRSNVLVEESFYQEGNPIGVWKTMKTDGSLIVEYNFEALVYMESVDNNGIVKDSTKLTPPLYADGGDEGFFRFIATNTSYPAIARDAGISGTVYIRGIVEKTGEFKPHSIARGANPYLDAEAWRVLSNVPDWEPATYNDEPIWSYVLIPIRFNLR